MLVVSHPRIYLGLQIANLSLVALSDLYSAAQNGGGGGGGSFMVVQSLLKVWS